MPALEFLCKDIGINTNKFTKGELLILEAELFFLICEELKKLFKSHYKNYFSLLNFDFEMEERMIETNFLRFVIVDILSTETYNLLGIALYTQNSEETIYELMSGYNKDPSLLLARKIIELHRKVRPELYRIILKKAIKIE